MKKNVILIVLNYNDYHTTISFLDKIKNYKLLDKIIVVDNNSQDNSFNKLSKYKSEKIDVIKSYKNGGYAYGNNFGLRYAEKYSPDYIFISNPDVIVEEIVMSKLIKLLEENESIALATCKMVEKNGEINERFAWKLPSYKDNIIQCFTILSKILKPTIYDKNLLNNNILEVGVVPGSFFVIKGDIFKEIDYFDERTFLFYEEEILAYKLKKLEKKSVILCSEKFIHNHSVTINKHYKKYIERYKILGHSKYIYIKNYLNVNRFKLKFFKIIFNLSKIEVSIIDFIKSIMYKINR